MTRLQTLRRIVLPQAMRVIVPPTGNETISMLKTSSLVSVIAFTELLYAVQLIYAVNYEVNPAAPRREPLVPRRHDAAVDRPVLHRAPLRPQLVARAAADVPAAPARQRHLRHARDGPGAGCVGGGTMSSGQFRSRGDGPRGGGAQALRPHRGPARDHARGPRRARRLHPRPLGLRQDHAAALHQPPREDRRGPHLGRRRARGLSPGGRPPARAARGGGRAQAGGDRDGLPALQPLRAHDGAAERHGRPAARQEAAAREAQERATRAARARRPRRQARVLPGTALRRPAAARGHRAGAGDGAQAHALRRADVGAGSRARRRGARRDARPRGRGDDDDRRHARDRLRARGRPTAWCSSTTASSSSAARPGRC